MLLLCCLGRGGFGRGRGGPRGRGGRGGRGRGRQEEKNEWYVLYFYLFHPVETFVYLVLKLDVLIYLVL